MAIDVRGLAPLLEIFDMPTSISFYRAGLQRCFHFAHGNRFQLGAAVIEWRGDYAQHCV